MANIKQQRERVNPPHVTLGDLRAATGHTLAQVCAAFSDATGMGLTRGALSAIESGIRRPSIEVLAALEVAYGLRPGAITTDYQPMPRKVAA